MDNEELVLALLDMSSSSSSDSTDEDDDIVLFLLTQTSTNIFIDRSRFDKNMVTEDLFFKTFRFYKEDFTELLELLQLPDYIHLQNRSIFTKEECLLCILERFSYPCRLINIAQRFGRQVSEVSLAINEGIEVALTPGISIIYNKWGDKIKWNRERINERTLETFASAIHEKGCTYRNVVGFVDGTFRPIDRPGIDQQYYYNGWKRSHGLKYQSIITPDGLIADVSGPYEGTLHDSFMMIASDFYQNIEENLSTNNKQYCIYGDAAYSESCFILKPYLGTSLSMEQKRMNKIMSKIRIAVEWSFGNIIQQFAFNDFKKNLKLNLQPVAKYYLISILFMNIRSCYYGSEITKYFNLKQDIKDYLC